MKFLSSIFIVLLKSALIQFLLSKYDFLEKNENFFEHQIKKNFNNNINSDEACTFKDINELFPSIAISKDLRNFKFYEFYTCFGKIYENLINLTSFSKREKEKKGRQKESKTKEEIINKLCSIIKILKNIKNFSKLKRTEIKAIISKHRKQNFKLSTEIKENLLYSAFFNNVKINIVNDAMNININEIKLHELEEQTNINIKPKELLSIREDSDLEINNKKKYENKRVVNNTEKENRRRNSGLNKDNEISFDLKVRKVEKVTMKENEDEEKNLIIIGMGIKTGFIKRNNNNNNKRISILDTNARDISDVDTEKNFRIIVKKRK